jgi:chemotaxis protein methyltransferase CheR
MTAIFHLEPFKDLIAKRCGLNFHSLSEATLSASLKRRIAATESSGQAAYLTKILADEAEFQELVTLLTVNETYFFREPAQLAFAIDHLFPRLLAVHPKGGPIRILSAGCSTGEEPYSIAMALHEKYGESTRRLATIVGVDIDRNALAAARTAHYGEFSFRALTSSLRERYFRRTADGSFRLVDELRSLVHFHPLNLLTPQFPPAISGFDIIFFRNVSIYFDTNVRKQILASLYSATNENGVLVLGASETMANDLGIFDLVLKNGIFHFVKTAQPAIPTLPSPAPAPAQPPAARSPSRTGPAERPGLAKHSARRPAQSGKAPQPSADWDEVLEAIRALLRQKKFSEALQSLAETNGADARFHLLEAYVRLLMRQFDHVLRIISPVIESDPWSPEALMVLALAAKWRNLPVEAVGHLKRLVYAKPNCWPARYHLATLLQATDGDMARREYGTAMRQISALPDPDGGLLLPLDLPIADIHFLCERQSREEKDGGQTIGISGRGH